MIATLLTLLTLVVAATTYPATSTTRAVEQFTSPATGMVIDGNLLMPVLSEKPMPLPTVVYLKNLSAPRLSQERNEQIVNDLVSDGCIVLVLDYHHHAKAISPDLNSDVLSIREAIAGKNRTLLANWRLIDTNRLFIIPEGFRLKRDVEFARDGKRVLAMDVIYPAQPAKPVPALLEITCDNVNRMGAGSLLLCRDTLLEGGALAGFAVAMIDHPVAPPYKGIDDPYPQLIDRLKAATKTLRGLRDECHLTGKIGAIGFSRGGPMAAILAAPHQDDVQAALVHGNYYDYLTLPPTDRMYARFEKAWGPRDADREKWAQHGAVHHLTAGAAPMFLNTSDAESPEFRGGLETLHQRLTQLNVEHVFQVDADGRGHRVTTDPKTLGKIYDFFRKHLQ